MNAEGVGSHVSYDGRIIKVSLLLTENLGNFRQDVGRERLGWGYIMLVSYVLARRNLRGMPMFCSQVSTYLVGDMDMWRLSSADFSVVMRETYFYNTGDVTYWGMKKI